MKLKYVKNGEVRSVTFSAYRDFTKPRAAIYHNGQTWYVPRIDADDSSASEFTFRHNNTNCALKTDTTVPAMVFSGSTAVQSQRVTLYSNYGDFGVLGDSLGSGGNGPGTEYYVNLVNITATEPNSTIIGNKENNVITAVGGTSNVMTGGISINGGETFIFKGGGGLITDFGAGKIKNADKAYLAGAPVTRDTINADGDVYIGYDRTDPSTYKQGVDVLKVYGTVKAIAYDGCGDSNTRNDPSFSAYVVYTADIDGKDYVVKLDNINKVVVNYTADVYRTDDVVAKAFNIWDTSTSEDGSLKQRTDIADSTLRSSIQDSPYKTLIEEFDAMIVSKE